MPFAQAHVSPGPPAARLKVPPGPARPWPALRRPTFPHGELASRRPPQTGDEALRRRITRAPSLFSLGTRYLFWRALPVGVRVLASGRVLFAGPFAGHRHLLIIHHGNSWHSIYGNLSSCEVKTGEIVKVRQRIGRYRAGQGTRAEPLWFEVWQGERPVHPKTWPALPSDWERKLFVKLNEPR